MTAPYQLLPPLAPDEMAELRASIEMHGVLVPVLVDENGVTIDGHHRLKLAAELGVECPTEIRTGLSDEQKRTLARTLNTARRHLTRDQKRALIQGQLLDTPGRSDNAIAKDLGVSDKTVTTVRADLQRRSEIPNVETRTDTKGRKQPATKSPASKPATRKPALPRPPVERVVPPPELRDPLKEFDAVVERELDRLEGVQMGRIAALALRRCCAKLRTAFAELLRAVKGVS